MNKKVFAIITFCLITLMFVGSNVEAADVWFAKAPMPTARYGLVAATVNGKIYAIGGYANSVDLAVNEEYNPATNTWTTKAPMPTARHNFAVAVVNNKIYAIGGQIGSNYSAVTEEYDPATNTWTTKASMPTARSNFAAAMVNNKIYAIGGLAWAAGLTANEEYNPATNTWTTKASLPADRAYLSAEVVNNKIYAIGGLDLSACGIYNTNEEYNPATNTWTTKTAIPFAAQGLALAVISNKIYAIGGKISGVDGTSNQVYDPATNTWTTKASMPTARFYLAAATVNNVIYAIGGRLVSISTALNANEEYGAEPVNGVCGSANGKTYASGVTVYAPDVQCSSGNSSNTAFPAQGGSVTWICNGINGGTASGNCTASRSSPAVNGVCGSANGYGYYSTTDIDTADERCAPGGGAFAGSFLDYGSYWSWNCNGTGGGTSATCTANKVACGIYHNTIRRDQPATNLCQYGTNTSLILAGTSWLWNCTNNPGTNAGCYTYKTTCGSANGGTYSSPPILADRCATNGGSASGVTTGSTTYTWTCTGNDSLPLSCSAYITGSGCLTGWSYKKQIDVSNSGSLLTNYQAKITVAYNAHMKTDFSDIRFTAGDGSTVLSYWLESKTDSTTADFWVKIPTVSAGGTTIFMYYGNSSAVTASDGEDTFIFFDDFSTSPLDPAKWTSAKWGSATLTISGGLASLYSPTGNANNQYIRSVQTFDVPVILETRYRQNAARYFGEIGFATSTDSTNLYQPGGNYAKQFIAGGYSQPSCLSTLFGCTTYGSSESASTFYRGTLKMAGTSEEVLLNDITKASRMDIMPSGAYHIHIDEVSPYNAAYQLDVDWVAVRKYSATAPTLVIGTETATTCGAVSGSCGSAAGAQHRLLTSGSSNLCALGTLSGFTGGTYGPWGWDCNGESGGESPHCTATLTNSSPTISYIVTAPSTINIGETATFDVVATDFDGDTLSYNWSCPGGGSLSNNLIHDPVFTPPAIANTYTCNVTVTDGYNGSRGGMGSVIVNNAGVCGSSNQKVLAAKPTTNLCSTGTASEVTGTGTEADPWVWTCDGASCSAAKVFLPKWRETGN